MIPPFRRDFDAARDPRTAANALQLQPGQMLATSTNDSAGVGRLGEYVSSDIASGSAVALTTATPANVTSISLTAGDWDVWINGFFLAANATVFTIASASISTTSATVAASPSSRLGLVSLPLAGFTGAGGGVSLNCVAGPARLSLGSTTTVYFVASATFTVDTMSAYGEIQARRVR